MSSSKKFDDGGSAFPVALSESTYTNQKGEPYQEGMTLRDWFAGQALAGICANPAWNDTFHESVMKPSAEAAVAMADALIAVLKEGA